MKWIAFALSIVLSSASNRAAEIEVSGKMIAVDRRPVFLLGCSYYGGVGASEDVYKKDLGELRNCGFNWIRVWATWAAYGKDVSVVDGKTGEVRAEYFERLKKLIEECDRRGMMVDVTLSRGNGATGPARLATFEVHQKAVEALVSGLKQRRNWWLDLGNERNIRDARFVSYEELAKLRDLAKKIDEKRLITASHAGGDLSREDLEKYLKVVKVDFVSVHRPRDEGSPAQTEAKTREMLKWMEAMGRVVPVHFDEPFRRGHGDWSPQAEDFLEDLKGAKAGGAAGWCFHNGGEKDVQDGRRRSFDLSQRGLMEQLDQVEREFMREMRNQNPNFGR
jgi:hypothetical protein